MPEFFTRKEVAVLLHSSPFMVGQWIKSGALKASRPGKRRLLISRDDLDAFIEARKVKQSDASSSPEVIP